MIESDPFEDFKRKRQIKKLEQKLTSEPDSPDAPVDMSQSQDGSGVASQVDSEMMDFFGDAQPEAADESAESEEPLVDDEPAPSASDGFQVTREQAEQVLSALGDAPDDAPATAFVEQLRSIFQQGVEEMAAVQGDLDPNASHDDAGGDEAESKAAIIPVEPSEPAVDVTKQGLEPERAGSADGEPKILKRQGHIPATKRRSGFSQLERAELRALKALLLAKGLITEDELRAEIARDLTP